MKQFVFADELNSMARLASAERAGSDISRFSDNCKKGTPGKKGYPQFPKDCRSVEYKTTGWKLADGLYIQFCVEVDRKENTEPCGTTIGLDVGLKEYYTDSNGITVENPKFLRKGKKVLQRSGRRLSRRVKGSKNRGSR
jgi:putative transposase